jgi:hypothetical protein
VHYQGDNSQEKEGEQMLNLEAFMAGPSRLSFPEEYSIKRTHQFSRSVLPVGWDPQRLDTLVAGIIHDIGIANEVKEITTTRTVSSIP